MKKYLLLATLLLTCVFTYGSENQPSRSSQFGLSRNHKSHKASPKSGHVQNKAIARHSSNMDLPPVRRGHFANVAQSNGSNASTVNFVSAARTAWGGTDDGETESVIGDFNGDGKMDVARIVTNVSGQNEITQIAVLLGNGDGTFQAAQLTTAPADTDGPILVADLNGDKKDDIILVQPTEPAKLYVLISNGDGTFTVGNNYTPTDLSLVGGLLTDINGDGKLDVLAFDNSSPADVIEMLGNGDGTFQAPSTLGTLTTSAPNNMIFGDFNGDGKIDFAGQLESGQLQVTLATGAGLFANAPVSLKTPDNHFGACTSTNGDLTGDSKPEIVSFNCNSNTVTVYVNQGDGSFATGVYYDNNGNLDQQPNSGVIADMNGDGKNDIVALNANAADITVFLGHGDGTVEAGDLNYDVGGTPFNTPLVADFNGDGIPDVVESDNFFNLVYLQGFGDGSFRAAPDYQVPNSFSQVPASFSVATGDFNGDGNQDVVIGTQANNTDAGVTVYLGKGDGTFFAGVNYGSQTDVAAVVAADFNGDGKLDIAAVDQNAGTLQIFLGNGDGTFNEAGVYPTDSSNPGPDGIATGDFNQDGIIDLAISNAAGTVGVFLGNGYGSFGNFTSYPIAGFSPQSITAADINGDGFVDLLVPATTDGPGKIAILLAKNDKTGTFNAPTAYALTGAPVYVAVGDLDKDGKPDMVITQFAGTFLGDVTVALGKGDGTFQAAVEYPSSALDGGNGNAGPANIAVLDLNGDGNPDLAYLNSEYGTFAVALGKGDGTIAAPTEFPATEFVFGMAMADVNNDGAVDVLAANNDVGGFSVLLNGAGTGTGPNFSVGTQTPMQTVTSGSAASYTLDLAGQNGYNGTITFACSNLPTGAKCSFSPASVVANGNTPLSTTLSISTTGSATAAMRHGSGSGMFLASLSGMGLFGLFLAGGTKGRQRRAKIVLGCVLLLMLSTLLGCSGSSKAVTSTVTPAGAYLVTVTSTGTGASAPTHTLNVSLVVQ